MKLVFASVLFFVSNLLFGQNTSVFFDRKNNYVYHSGKDTLHLTSLGPDHWGFCDTLKIVDSIQIDGMGAKEIVFYRNCSSVNEGHGGTYDISENKTVGKYEIWNLDTKQVLFEAVNYYMFDYNRFNANQTPQRQQGKDAYIYDFTVEQNGEVHISNLRFVSNVKSDHEVGIYKFVNGVFIKQ